MEVGMSEISEWEKQKKFIKDLCNTWENSKKKKTVSANKVVENKAYCTLKESFNYTSSTYKDDWDRIFNHTSKFFTEDGDGSLLNEAARKSVKKKVSKKKKTSSAKKAVMKENKPNKKPYDLLNPDSFKYVDLKSSLEEPYSNDTDLNSKVKKLANLPNRVNSYTYGRDGSDKSGKTKVAAGWTEDPNMRKLEDLKKKLYDLECKMSKPDGLDEIKAKKMQKQFTKLNNDIADLSDKFTGDYKTNHYYG
jgi:hypothetical protein